MRIKLTCMNLAVTIVLSVLCSYSNAQVRGNYVKTETYLSASQKIQSYKFYDGLGRDIVMATNSISSNGNFSISLKEIEGENLVSKKWLPVVGNSQISDITKNAISQAASVQYSDGKAYEESEYDALGRKIHEKKAGNEWKNRSAKTTYITNGVNDVKKYTIASFGATTPSEDGYYKAGTLSGTTTVTEDGATTTVFKDVFGNKILERKGVNNDTYIVYDSFGRVALVLMPEYQTNKNLEKFSYRYIYDLRGNNTEKYLPGGVVIKYQYDANNRCVSMQDGELKKQGLYRFMLYDNLGRLVVQGLSSTLPSNSSWATANFSMDTGGLAYTNYVISDGTSHNITVKSIEKINYYDDYRFLSGSQKSLFTGMTQPTAALQKGMLTGSIVLASNGERLPSIYTYDVKGNMIGSLKKGLNGVIEKVDNIYTYTDKLNESKVAINHPNGIVEYQTIYSYDSKNDKLTDVTRQASIGSVSTNAIKFSYEYDDQGRLINLKRPINGSENEISYEYNIQGWLTKIGSSSFTEQIHYNDGLGTHLWGGNISSVTWKDGQQTSKGYKYTYDEFSRLIKSQYGENDFADAVGHFDENVEYDSNGNIKHLVRNGLMQNGDYGAIDNITIDYDGNKLNSITESAVPVLYNNSMDVKKSSSDIKYNSNGSLVYDGTRGITNIKYDNNDNPIRIQFENGGVTKYIYSAEGHKLRTIHYSAVENTHVIIGDDYDDIEDEYLSVDSTDYLLNGIVQFSNNHFSRISFAEGYLSARYVRGHYLRRPIRNSRESDESYSARVQGWIKRMSTMKMLLAYKYYNKDHLGNIRQVVNASGNIEQINNYYPYGMPYYDKTAMINNNNQPFKYNGKEFDMMHGLYTYDYGARQYNPVVPSWDRMEPLYEKYYDVSPYAYCHNDPVNRVDPDGKDDYYTSNGTYLGSNKAETDFIYIANSYRQLADGRYVIKINKRVNLSDVDLEAEAYSKIFTNSLLLSGININSLVDNKIQVTVWDGWEGGSKVTSNYTNKASIDGTSLAYTDKDHSKGALITAFIWPQGTKERDIFISRSNIESCLGVHEKRGHYDKGYKHKFGKPDATYKEQIGDRSWTKTTENFKEYIQKVIKENGYAY